MIKRCYKSIHFFQNYTPVGPTDSVQTQTWEIPQWVTPPNQATEKPTTSAGAQLSICLLQLLQYSFKPNPSAIT